MATNNPPRLRSTDLSCPLLGNSEDLKTNVLPTKEMLLKYYLHLKAESGVQKPKGLHYSVTESVLEIWRTSSIPTVSKPQVQKLVNKLLESYASLKKDYARKESNAFKLKFEKFKGDIKQLFDISSCKCINVCCECPKERKVPLKERDFLTDQRTDRKMVIGPVDRATTSSMNASKKRKLKDSSSIRQQATNLDDTVTMASSTSSSASDSENSADDFEKELAPHQSLKKTKKYTPSMTNFAFAIDRCGLSSRKASMVATAAIQDLLTGKEVEPKESDELTIIDRNKVMREVKKNREQVMASYDFDNVTNLYFDGRKDKTLIMKEAGSKKSRSEIVEEHITVLTEPGSRYLGHFSLSNGSASNIANGLYDFCLKNNIDTNKIDLLGCDGTNTNVGWKAGAIRKFEEKLGKPLHWNICQLHSNELPLRHLLINLDGKTSGPRQFTGPVGKSLYETEFENTTVAHFQQIKADDIDISDEYISELSFDQKYLLKMYRAVSSGFCDESLASQKPGKMAHSRWLTTASRALRLYISTETPSENLVLLVNFIMSVYTPMWFKIKCQSDLAFAPLHIHETITRCKKLPQVIRDIVFPVIQRNAFGAHHESILFAMLSGKNHTHAELAWRKILKCRHSRKPEGHIRHFIVPTINFNADNYINLIDWNKTTVTEPPLTSSIPTSKIETIVHTKTFNNDFSKFPCHTQSVERHIKVVTEASSSVCGQTSREGNIRSKLKSRAAMPQFDTKSQYRALN